MEKKHIISLTGDLASGKGETSRVLIEKLGYGIYRNGQYFRKLAKDMNMSVTEFNIYVEEHPEIDRQIENSAAEYAKNNDNFIIDARLGWYAVPESFKVYLKVDIDVAAKYNHFSNVPEHKNRDKFFEGIKKGSINSDNVIDVMNKYTRVSIVKKILRKGKRIAKKVLRK